jgi:hypothetical protein
MALAAADLSAADTWLKASKEWKRPWSGHMPQAAAAAAAAPVVHTTAESMAQAIAEAMMPTRGAFAAAAAAQGGAAAAAGASDHKADLDDGMGMKRMAHAIAHDDTPKRECDTVKAVVPTVDDLRASQFFAPDPDQIVAVFDNQAADNATYRLILDREDTRGYCMVLHRKNGVIVDLPEDDTNSKKRRMGERDVVKALGTDKEHQIVQPEIHNESNFNYFADDYELEALYRIAGLITAWLNRYGVSEMASSTEPFMYSDRQYANVSLVGSKRVSLDSIRLGIPTVFVPHIRFWVRWGDSKTTTMFPNEPPQRNGRSFVATDAIPYRKDPARAALRRFLSQSLKSFVNDGGAALFTAQLKITDEQ